MSLKTTFAAALLASLAAGQAFAADPSYPGLGKENPQWNHFTVKKTGHLYAYFLGSSTTYAENIAIASKGAWLGPGLNTPSNTALTRGQKIDFGQVTAGDSVDIFLSIPAPNRGVYSDKNLCTSSNVSCTPNGVYATHFAGDPGSSIPAGVYVGFEDTSWDSVNGSDWDYNDSEYIFPNLKLTTSD